MADMSVPIHAQPEYRPQEYRRDERPAQNRERAVSSMSTVSARSRRSSDSKRLDLTESAKDKKRLYTKADPSKALAEATPAEVALTDSTLENLRDGDHKDKEGNTITEPDRSNPTRYRFERPLDTIRSFAAAAEGTSHRRTSYNGGARPQSQYGSEMGGNRRSYYGNGQTPMSPPRQRPAGNGGYYRNSSYGFQHQDSVMEEPQEAPYYARSTQQMRQPLQPHHPNAHPNGYPQDNHLSVHSHQQSYETMTSGSDENSKSTNPSSLNSSFDQLHQIRKPADMYAHPPQQHQPNQYANDMNFSPVSPPQGYNNYGRSGPYAAANGPQYGGPVRDAPQPPPKEVMSAYRPNNPRQPIKLDGGGSSGMSTPTLTKTNSGNGKRQSWLKRKFSRKDKD